MNDLSIDLLSCDYNRSYNESSKQSQVFNFEDGSTQTIGYKSVSAITIDLVYRNISKDEFDVIDEAYQNNHSNTFLVEFSDNEDPRISYTRINNGVFAFGGYSFNISAQQKNRYNGKITLVTSVIFNYTEFSDIFNQPSSYSANLTANQDFIDVLSEINPNSVEYGYELNKRFSNLGKSVQTQDDLGNHKKTWKLKFLCGNEDWIRLITFFRKKGTIGTFGIPEEGYFLNITQRNILARFSEDTLKHSQQIGNLYSIEFNIIEVK